jgi:hypothetical protein
MPLMSDDFAGCPSPFLQNGVEKYFLKIDKFAIFFLLSTSQLPHILN